MKLVHGRGPGTVEAKERIGSNSGPAQHGPSCREINFNLGNKVLYRRTFGLRLATRPTPARGDCFYGKIAGGLGDAEESSHQSHVERHLPRQGAFRPLPPRTVFP